MAEKGFRKRPKKRLGSYPAVSVVFSIFLALFIIGLFGLLLIHTSKLSGIIKQNIEVQVYLDKSISDTQITQIQKRISTENYILSNSDGPQVLFVSKEEAAEQFKKDTGEDFSNFLGENPLRDLFRIKINSNYQFSDSLRNVSASIENMSGVYEVVYVENLVDSINDNVTKVSLVLLGIAALLVLIVILLINNTIKLALFSQRFLIRSMQLVGATAQFIQRPFITRSIMYGLLAGLIACGSLFGIMRYAYREIEELATLNDEKSVLILFVGILVIGVILATISTYKAISRYLKMSLDDLY